MVELRHGRLENPAYHEWLTAHVHHVFVNNFADVFGHRSEPKKTTVTVDSRIAAMFASMKPGSIMVTLYQIDALGPCQAAVLGHRERHKLRTPEKAHASFFSMEKMELGPAKENVSWSALGGSTETIWVYKYTRLEQPNVQDAQPVFLCTNSKVGGCERSRNAEPIPATVNGKNGLLMNFCDCGYQMIQTRAQTKKSS